VTERCPIGKFVTFVFALLEPATGRLVYAKAGHKYPLVITAGGQVEQLRRGGLILGIESNADYPSDETALDPGDLIALYSDGVTEARGPNGDEFGERGLTDFLLHRRTLSSAALVTALVDHVRTWCGRLSFHDDFTVVLLRRL
jgi:sigma-B regulation protein RsbU (phosphoserine phosphatase)